MTDPEALDDGQRHRPRALHEDQAAQHAGPGRLEELPHLFVGDRRDPAGHAVLEEQCGLLVRGRDGGVEIGSPGSGQSWEIDEPGFTTGNLLSNFQGGFLDGTNGNLFPDDVAMGLGWTFDVDPGKYATIWFHTSLVQPQSRFFLAQYDVASQQVVFLWSTLKVPEPGWLALLTLGLLGIGAARARRQR